MIHGGRAITLDSGRWGSSAQARVFSGGGEVKDGLSVVGLGVAACFAGPILAVLGGISLAGLASTWLIGGFGLGIAAVAGLASLAVHRRRAAACATALSEPVSVALIERTASR